MSRVTAVCARCRTASVEQRFCDCAAPSWVTIAALKSSGRQALTGPPWKDRGPLQLPTDELAAAQVSWLRGQLAAGRAVLGTVRADHVTEAPLVGGDSVAAAVVLLRRRPGGYRLRSLAWATSYGFAIAIDDGRIIEVPPQEIDLRGPAQQVANDEALSQLIRRQTGLPDAIFPRHEARVAAVAPGETVAVFGPLIRRGGAIVASDRPVIVRVPSTVTDLPAGEARVIGDGSGSALSAAWPERTQLCLECCGLFGAGESCRCPGGGPDVPVRDVARFGETLPALLDAKPLRREDEAERYRPRTWFDRAVDGAFIGAVVFAILAPFDGAALAVLAVAGTSAVLMRRRARLILGGAPKLLADPVATREGIVRAGETSPAPISGEPCVACAIELRDTREGHSDTVLRVALTVGFRVETDAGEIVEIPAGAVELIGDADARFRPARLGPLMDWLFPGRGWDGQGPFACDAAYELLVRPGDRVRVRAGTESAPDRVAGPGLYRQGAAVARPVSMAVVELVEPGADSARPPDPSRL